MAVARRIVSDIKVDDHTPQAAACLRCTAQLDFASGNAHYGRIVAEWKSKESTEIIHGYNGGRVMQIPVTTEQRYPRKVAGWCCGECYTELWNTTWYDKSEHLRRAFEHVSLPVEQPKNDDYDASPITKGLYAPHVGKRKQRKADFYETASNDRPSAVIDTPPKVDRKLTGFDRPKRDDIRLKPRKTIVKGGKWKVDPTEYNYQPPKTK